ncbi:MAG: hypothetical protein R6V03_08145 [Kiritimatiellia bacterium]
MSIKSDDRDILRKLAGEMAETAAQPVQKERMEGWRRLNDLEPQRPMLWITEIPWGEFSEKVDELKLRCDNHACRQVEFEMRTRLFTQRHLPCDEVAEDKSYFGKVISGTGYGVQVSETRIEQGDSYVLSHDYEPVIKSMEDVELVQMPRVRHEKDKTEQRRAFREKMFGDIFPPESAGPRKNFFPAWDEVVRWTGVTEALMDLAMRPDYIHALMRRVTDSMLERMRQLEELGLYSAPHPLLRVGSGAAGFTKSLPGPDAGPGHFTPMDLWGGATPQIFSEVSPEMHEEFALKYEIEVMERCGLNYYGCCEPLHNKMHLMAKVPRLRKISISPWCDVGKARDGAAETYVFSHKPNPSILAEDKFDAARAEADIRARLEQSGEMPCEIIMKDISTVRGDVQRVIDWCEMAYRVCTE